MPHTTLINTYVFLFCFGLGYLLAGRRPVLTLLTRLVLVVLFGFGLAFVALPSGVARDIAGGGTLIANVLFLVFGVVDYLDWHKNSTAL